MISTAVAITHICHMFLHKGHTIKWKLDKAEHLTELTSVLLCLSTHLDRFNTFHAPNKSILGLMTDK